MNKIKNTQVQYSNTNGCYRVYNLSAENHVAGKLLFWKIQIYLFNVLLVFDFQELWLWLLAKRKDGYFRLLVFLLRSRLKNMNDFFIYEILVLIKNKKKNVCCFSNDTNNNLYYKKNCLRV